MAAPNCRFRLLICLPFRLKYGDLVQGCVDHYARDGRTTASKTFATWFFRLAAIGSQSCKIGATICALPYFGAMTTLSFRIRKLGLAKMAVLFRWACSGVNAGKGDPSFAAQSGNYSERCDSLWLWPGFHALLFRHPASCDPARQSA